MLEMEWWRRLDDMYGYGMLYWHALQLAIVKDTWVSTANTQLGREEITKEIRAKLSGRGDALNCCLGR